MDDVTKLRNILDFFNLKIWITRCTSFGISNPSYPTFRTMAYLRDTNTGNRISDKRYSNMRYISI